MSVPQYPQGGFCGGEPQYRAARLRAAIACQKYNSLLEDVRPEERNAAWFEIVRPTTSTDLIGLTSEGLTLSPNPITSLATPPGTPLHSKPPSRVSSHSDSSKPDLDGGYDSQLDELDQSTRGLLPTDPITPRASNDGLQIEDPVYQLDKKRRHINLYPGYGQAPYVKGPIHIDYGLNLHIGSTTFINRGCMILDTPNSEVRIGEQCLIGPGVHFYGVTHPLDADIRLDPKHPASSISADIRLGDRCWIGGGAKILGGVTIGEGAVIGAGSVVTKSVAPYTVAYGVPARFRRHIPRNHPTGASTQSHGCVLPGLFPFPVVSERWRQLRDWTRHWPRDHIETAFAVLVGLNVVSVLGVAWLLLERR